MSQRPSARLSASLSAPKRPASAKPRRSNRPRAPPAQKRGAQRRSAGLWPVAATDPLRENPAAGLPARLLPPTSSVRDGASASGRSHHPRPPRPGPQNAPTRHAPSANAPSGPPDRSRTVSAATPRPTGSPPRRTPATHQEQNSTGPTGQFSTVVDNPPRDPITVVQAHSPQQHQPARGGATSSRRARANRSRHAHVGVGLYDPMARLCRGRSRPGSLCARDTYYRGFGI